MGLANLAEAKAQFLLDFLSGDLGGKTDKELAASVVRVIVAGNATSPSQSGQDHSPPRHLDAFLAQLASIAPVDVMPGSTDPSHAALPQPPLHRALLPKSLPLVDRVTNPHCARIGGCRVLGSAGQNVEDVMSFSSFDEPLDVLESMFMWRHLAPTAPDTLACHSFTDRDPFVITERPSVLFAGNQSEFSTRLVNPDDGSEPVRLISVPSFWSSPIFCLVDLDDLSVIPVSLEWDTN